MRDGITVFPANEASWEDLQAILGERGYAAACQCQRFKMPHVGSRSVFAAAGFARGQPAVPQAGRDAHRFPRRLG